MENKGDIVLEMQHIWLVGGLEHFLFVPIILGIIIPTDSYFFRGVGIPLTGMTFLGPLGPLQSMFS